MKKSIVFIFLFFLLKISFVQAVESKVNDPYFFEQWYLEAVNVQALWDLPVPSHKTIVAVLDTGVDIDHPDLRDHIWINKDEIPKNGKDDDNNGYIDDVNGWDFLQKIPDPRPKKDEVTTDIGFLHGTSVASVLGAVSQNKKGIAGVNNSVIIMPLRVLASDGFGNTTEVAEAIDYAIVNGAEVINLSFVGPDNDPHLEEAILRAYKKGVVVVVAAGNGAENIAHSANSGIDLNTTPMYPVCYGGKSAEDVVIGVGAIDVDDAKTKFSNFGSNCVDIFAPGAQFFTASVFSSGSKYYRGHFDGTSLATPLVSGVAAFLKSWDPTLSPKEIFKILAENSPNQHLDLKKIAEFLSKKKNADNFSWIYPSFSLDGSGNILTINGAIGGQSTMTLYDILSARSLKFLLYPDSFLHGSETILGDVDKDGLSEIITAPNPGGGPQIRIFRSDGSLVGQFFAFPENFHGGVGISFIKKDERGEPALVVVPKENNVPEVRVFDVKGNLLRSFLAYDARFQKGIIVKTADLDHDGKEEIIVAPNPGGGAQIRIFRSDGSLIGQFFAFEKEFRGGIHLNFVDINQDGYEDIVVSPRGDHAPEVRVFDAHGNLLSSFLAYAPTYKNGFSTAVSDINGDDIPEIITAPNPGGGPQIRIFRSDGSLVRQFFAFEENMRKGLNVKIFDLHNDGKKEIAITPKMGIIPRLRIFDSEGKLFFSSLLSTLVSSE